MGLAPVARFRDKRTGPTAEVLLSVELTFADAVARRRKRLVWVRILRRLLPAVAAVIFLAVLGQIAWRSIRIVLIPQEAAPAAGVRMQNPSFTGQSRDGSRYQVSARSGLRDAADENRITLDSPVVTVTQGDSPRTRTTARQGVFRQDDMTLNLEGDVKVQEESGYGFTFRTATFDTRTGQVVGRDVQSQGPSAQVSSDQYSVTEKGDRMVFKGRVRGRIEGRSAPR
jgi:lipopolysaccharide export system protein LptC